MENYGFVDAADYDLTAESFDNDVVKVNADFETGSGVNMYFKIDRTAARVLQLQLVPSNINSYHNKLEKIAGENFYIIYQRGISELENSKDDVFVFTLGLNNEDCPDDTPAYELRYKAKLHKNATFEIKGKMQWHKSGETEWNDL
jgi:hypothetical protein